MSSKQLIECVPNFSEGVNMDIINAITNEISSVSGVKLLDVDPGKATNRTVVTFVGEPKDVIEAAVLAIKKAGELIDMSTHSGEHPRMGATDVCPLIPIANISMAETVKYAEELGQRVGEECGIPVYLYESAAKKADRKNLAVIRSGEYEGFEKKMQDPHWAPDYGPTTFNKRSGATVIGARDFLVAYNINLNTTSTKRANSVAFDIRENGRVKRSGHPVSGPIVRDADGNAERVPGLLKTVKAIGWYIEEYGIAQISMNLTDINTTSLHKAFETTRECANKRGLRVTGSELVGLVPKKVLIDAGLFFLKQQNRSVAVSEEEIMHIAVKSLGLDELGPFDPKKKVIEYLLEDESSRPLIHKNLIAFANETASESPAPGGGSIAAYVGALGAALGTMVANLSANKSGWEDQLSYFSEAGAKGQAIKDRLLQLVDDDTQAFTQIMVAIRMPKASPEEKAARKAALNAATKNAIEVPLMVMQTAHDTYSLLEKMAEKGNPASVSDAGVGALCAHAAVYGAYLNVLINCAGFGDTAYADEKKAQAKKLLDTSAQFQTQILATVEAVIQKEA